MEFRRGFEGSWVLLCKEKQSSCEEVCVSVARAAVLIRTLRILRTCSDICVLISGSLAKKFAAQYRFRASQDLITARPLDCESSRPWRFATCSFV